MVHLNHPHRQTKLSPSIYSGCCTSSCCSRCVQRALSEACAAIIPDCRLAYVRIYLAPWLHSLGTGPHSNPRSASSSHKTGRSDSTQEIIMWEIVQESIVSDIKQLARQIIQSLHCAACSIPVLAPIRTQQGAPEITPLALIPFISHFDSALPPRQVMSDASCPYSKQERRPPFRYFC